MAIALPSINEVISAARRSAVRFPLVLAAALVTTVAGVVLTGKSGNDLGWTRVLVAGSLGLPLLFAVTMFVEARALPKAHAVLLYAAALCELFGIAMLWRGWTDSERTLHYALFSSAFHFAAAFLPYAGRNAPDEFWQYNRSLFLRFLTAALYVLVLFAGLSAALGAINILFKAHIAGETFGRLFIIDAAAFGTWFFVSGIPDPLSSLAGRTDYPDGLRKFSEFVLIPLVVVYLAILTTYLVKVLVTHEWPSGWIGYLVSFVTIAGILAWLLVRPLEDRAAQAWVKGFTRGFFIALLPSIVMLWMALYKRVHQYGLTERRTIALAGALWLSGIALFYIISRSRNIKLIPMTLCLLTLLLSGGPFSVFSLSRRNQMARLERVLQRNQLLKDGKLARTTRAVSDSDAIMISETIWYLQNAHGKHVLDAWLSDSTRREIARGDTLLDQYRLVDREAELVMASLGVPFNRWNTRSPLTKGGDAFEYNGGGAGPFDVRGYEYLTAVNAYAARNKGIAVGDSLVLRVAPDSTELRIMRDSAIVLVVRVDSAIVRASRDSVQSPLVSGTVRVARAGPPARPPLEIDAAGSGVRVRLFLSNLSATRRDSIWRIQEFNGNLLLGAGPTLPPP